MIVAATPPNIERAAELLRASEVIAFPTETVYGLGANALQAEAVAKIFEAKQRPAYNPLIVHVQDVEAAQKVLSSWPERAQMLAEKFWPGPLTIVLPKNPVVPDKVSAGLPTVGVRVPSHPVAQALLHAAQMPIAAPSANTFMHISPTQAAHVEKSLGARVPLILDGGAVSIGIESTVISLCEEQPVLLRPGAVSRAQLETALGMEVCEAKVLSDESARSSPGMLDRHYAPRVPTKRFHEAQLNDAQDLAAAARCCGALLWKSTLDAEYVVPMPADAALYAQKLFAALHELEDAGCDLILIETPPDDPQWQSVLDRVLRASTKL
jgi:L-threonylcarbamoyladenylate synthase